MSNGQHYASFRDPDGFLFWQNGALYRQVNKVFSREYDHFIESGLYRDLANLGRIVTHKESDISPFKPNIAYKVIRPERLPFISYPYEWSFSQLKEAALVTLFIQKRALKFGMSLKDASAYNIQFFQGKAILIDTLSFELYKEGEPWIAYHQFCEHFLAPLALMVKKDIRLNQLMRQNVSGIPLDLTSKLLPLGTRFNPGILMHIHLHARAQMKFADQGERVNSSKKKMGKQALLALINSLEHTIKKLTWKSSGTEWENYYDFTNYTDAGFKHKKQLIVEWLKEINPKYVWDLGANNGEFSRLAAEQGAFTVSFDIDPAAVDQNFRQVKKNKEKNLLPLLLDLTNPSPAIGWRNKERESLIDRAPADMVFALALIHHLTISNNIPFSDAAKFLCALGKWLIIEFIPKTDSQVQRLLQSRKDIFDTYSRENFERIFEERYTIHKKEKIQDSERYLYLMEKR